MQLKRIVWSGVASILLGLPLAAQTLQQAESLWRVGRYHDATEAFQQLIAQHPENPEYRVRCGRLFIDYGFAEEARALFQEALNIKKDYAEALFGLALANADTYGTGAAQLARKALEIDPRLVGAQELLARLALEDNDNRLASEEATKALVINPHSVQGKAILAALDWLADKKYTQWDPQDARGYQTVGRIFMLNRRYPESVEFYRKALELNPQLYPVRSELGITLMRLGQNDEAFRQLNTCFENGFRNRATVNTLRLLDSYKNFVTFKTASTILRLHKKEAGLLRPYFQDELDRAVATYEKKYKHKLSSPVQVEAYPDHEDFAVRTMGMPGLGALGVTFGYVIAMDSPSSRKPGSFHWDSTMWHELSHVYVLSMTNSRVPRWFTEGLAVFEETAAAPDWGDRLDPEAISAIKNKKLLPVAELDRGFIHPSYPSQVIVSYFQAGKICGFINEKWGYDRLLGMIHDFAALKPTPEVIELELKLKPEEFDRQFLTWIEARTKKTVDGFDEWKKRIRGISESAKAKNWDEVIKEGTAIRDLYSDYVEAGSVYEFLAEAWIAKGDKAKAMAELERYSTVGGRNPATLKQLAALESEQGRKREAATALERLNLIYLKDEEAHKRLGELYSELGNSTGAIREFQAVLAGSPIDLAGAHYQLARAFQAAHRIDEARDEVIAALEAAPGFKPAQKLLLELDAKTNMKE